MVGQCAIDMRSWKRTHMYPHVVNGTEEEKDPIFLPLCGCNIKYCFIESLIDNSLDPLPSPKQRVETSTGTKAVTYRTINSDLSVTAVYKSEERAVPEYARISFTRMRLSSHRLRIETGRWARVKREDRTCRCGEDVQDDRHVLQFCSLADEVRREQGLCFPDCLNNCQPPNILKIHKIYKSYDDL